MINFIKKTINSFKDNYSRETTFERAMKGKKKTETRNNELLERAIEQDDETLGLYRKITQNEDWHEKYITQKKFNGEVLELILKEITDVRTTVQQINNKFEKVKKENRRLSKENEKLLAKQLGE